MPVEAKYLGINNLLTYLLHQSGRKWIAASTFFTHCSCGKLTTWAEQSVWKAKELNEYTVNVPLWHLHLWREIALNHQDNNAICKSHFESTHFSLSPLPPTLTQGTSFPLVLQTLSLASTFTLQFILHGKARGIVLKYKSDESTPA